MRGKLILIFMILLRMSVFAENVRGPVSGVLSLDGERQLNTKIEHITGITVDGVSSLVQGVKLTLKADESMALYRNSFALYLYKDLDAPFNPENSSYRGSQALMRFIPFTNDLNILIPLNDNHTMSPDRSTVLLSDRDYRNDFPLVLSILPVSKGIPDSVYKKEISIELTPVYFDKGQLNLSLINDRGEPVQEGITLSIDGKIYPWPGGPYVLSSGLHTLDIRTEDGSEDSLSFSLEAGEEINLDHVLQYQLPLMTIETIEGLAVYLDGRKLTLEELENSIEIQPGGHNVQFELGDFKLSRDFTAEMQDRITITMIPEILLDYR